MIDLDGIFFHAVLLEVGLPHVLIHFIMHCITYVSSNVLWDGRRYEFFFPGRGVRQGDPISPYIFVLCMDKLSHLISQVVDEGSWIAPKAGVMVPMFLTLCMLMTLFFLARLLLIKFIVLKMSWISSVICMAKKLVLKKQAFVFLIMWTLPCVKGLLIYLDLRKLIVLVSIWGSSNW